MTCDEDLQSSAGREYGGTVVVRLGEIQDLISEENHSSEFVPDSEEGMKKETL